jgi:hypothetical protein
VEDLLIELENFEKNDLDTPTIDDKNIKYFKWVMNALEQAKFSVKLSKLKDLAKSKQYNKS